MSVRPGISPAPASPAAALALRRLPCRRKCRYSSPPLSILAQPLVNPRRAHPGAAFRLFPARDLLRAPARLQPLLEALPVRRAQLARPRRAVRLVALPVAPQLARDRRLRPAQDPGDRLARMPLPRQRLDLHALLGTQLPVFRHDRPPFAPSAPGFLASASRTARDAPTTPTSLLTARYASACATGDRLLKCESRPATAAQHRTGQVRLHGDRSDRRTRPGPVRPRQGRFRGRRSNTPKPVISRMVRAWEVATLGAVPSCMWRGPLLPDSLTCCEYGNV